MCKLFLWHGNKYIYDIWCEHLFHLFQKPFALSVSLTAHWVTYLAHTRWPLCNHVTSAAHSYGEWKRPSCAAVSIHHHFHSTMWMDKDPVVLYAVFSVSACKMVCHKKCLSKITVNCTGHCDRKVSTAVMLLYVVLHHHIQTVTFLPSSTQPL